MTEPARRRRSRQNLRDLVLVLIGVFAGLAANSIQDWEHIVSPFGDPTSFLLSGLVLYAAVLVLSLVLALRLAPD